MNESEHIDEDRKAGCGVIIAEKKVLHVERPERDDREPPSRARNISERKDDLAERLQDEIDRAFLFSPSPKTQAKEYHWWTQSLARLLDCLGRVDPDYKQTLEVIRRDEQVPLTAKEMREAGKLMAAVKERGEKE